MNRDGYWPVPFFHHDMVGAFDSGQHPTLPLQLHDELPAVQVGSILRFYF